MVALQHFHFGIGVLQPIEGLAEPQNHISLHHPVLFELGVRCFGADLAAQTELSGIEKLLREAEADVAGRLRSDAAPWQGIAVARVAKCNGWIGQAALLPPPLAGRFLALL